MSLRKGTPRDPNRSLKQRSESLMRKSIEISKLGCQVALYIEGLEKKIFFTTHRGFTGDWDAEDITDHPEPYQILASVSPPNLELLSYVQNMDGDSPQPPESPCRDAPFGNTEPYQQNGREAAWRGAVSKKRRAHSPERLRKKRRAHSLERLRKKKRAHFLVRLRGKDLER